MFAIAASALAIGAPPSVNRRVPNSIIVGDHSPGVCGGICTCFFTKVQEDGRVSTRSCLRFKELRQEGDFTVSPSEAAEFRRILAPLRLGPMRRGNCDGLKGFDGQPPHVTVRWKDDHPATLISCHDPDVDQAIAHALLAVGAYSENGMKIDPARRKAAAQELEFMDRHRR